MAHRIKSLPSKNSNTTLSWVSLLLACLGTLDAIYLLVYKLTNIHAMCLGNGGCHDVNFSPFSQIAGIPVSVFGLAAYLGIAGILLLERHLKIANESGPLAIFGISLAGVAFTIYLTWLELYVIHAICPFCVASAVIITSIFVIAIIRLVKQTAY
jgi:uncharacterized membrane protein